MLILSRKMFESVLISPASDFDPNMTVGELFASGPIKVTVTTIESNRVRVAIDAPTLLRVMRAELKNAATK